MWVGSIHSQSKGQIHEAVSVHTVWFYCLPAYQFAYQVRSHLLFGILQSWIGHWARRTGWSMKKPIRFFLNLLSQFLKVLIVPESMTFCGSSFHLSITQWEKKDRRKSRWHRGLSIFAVWPRVFVTVLIVKKWPNWVDDHLLKSLNTCSKSSNVHIPSRSSYGSDFHSGTIRVNRCCIRSSSALSLT